MGICAAHAKGTDARQAPPARIRARYALRRHHDLAGVPRNIGIGGVEVQVRRNLFMLQREHHFNQPRDARCPFQMSNICFYGTNQ